MKLTIACSLTILSCMSTVAYAQITEADYQRASGLREKMSALAIKCAGPITWIESDRPILVSQERRRRA